MHEQAIDILSSCICGVGLKRRQIKERKAAGGCHEADIAQTEADVIALERSICYLQNGGCVSGATLQLCLLLDRLTWEGSLTGLRCRMCRMNKPEHKEGCEVKKIMQAIHAEELKQ